MKLKKLMISLLFLSFIFSISVITLNNDKVIAISVDAGSSEAYIPTSSTIKTYNNLPNSKYIDMNSLYSEANGSITETSIAPADSQIVHITTSTDLYAFSILCNSNTRFLGYNYELTNNIDYGQEIAYNVVGSSTNPFSGTFDGNGFTISNLHFKSYTTEDGAPEYIAMFSNNSGTIKGIGLIDTELVQSSRLNNTLGVAPLCGTNSGTINNSFVQDLRDATEEAGISAIGYAISGLCCTNSGTIDTVYVAYSIVINYTMFDYEIFRPILISNEGTINNLYFYDGSIDEIKGEYYVYNDSLLGDVSIKTSDVIGTYKSSINDLKDVFKTFDGWYSNDNYSFSYLDIELPIYRGLKENNKVLEISSTLDFAYMYEMFNYDSYFASNEFTYKITCDIDLSEYPKSCFVYDDLISCNFEGIELASSNLLFNNDDTSNYPTILNPYLDNTINYIGFKSYGLFPLFDGTFKNLNIYVSNEFNSFSEYDESVPIQTFGVLSGYLEGATISNVNIYANVNLVANNNNIGECYIGGAIGILSQNSTITNLSVSGSINGNTSLVTNLNQNSTVDYVVGNVIGGAIAYIGNDGGNINNVITNVNITSISYSASTDYNTFIGGVVGCGYFNKFNNISSFGEINLNNSSSYYGSIYAAGIIGKVIGIENRMYSIHNQSNINVNIHENKKFYISGITNVMLNLNDSTHNISSLSSFYGSGLSNSGVISITKSLTFSSLSDATSKNIFITNGIYLENGAEIEGLYNLNYKYDNSYNTTSLDDTINIDVSFMDKYAPCLFKVNEDYANVSHVYNFRPINLTTSNIIYFNEVLYTGCIIGKNIDMTDIRNEGAISCTISNNAPNTLIYDTSNFKKFIITGVFEEVSSGRSANVISNNGNINFYIDSSVTSFIFNLYISGICYANRNGYTDSTFASHNPFSDSYDEDLVGSLNNVINNGIITSTNSGSETTTIEPTYEYSANGYVKINVKYTATNTNTAFIYGNSNISGICMYNESIISNAFNLGNITNFNYIVEPSGDYNFSHNFEVNSGGLCFLNSGKYAQIKDSANNGVIKSFNMSSIDSSWANSSGIVVRNDIDEEFNDYAGNTNNASQMILFTINYGEIYSHNYCENVDSIEKEQHAKSAGIMALGLCSIMNTVNYGNIYGSEISSGVFGLVKFSLFENEISSSNKVIIANSINYGNIWGINKGSQYYNEEYSESDNNYLFDNQTYDELLAMSFSNQSDYASIEQLGFAKNTYLGSIIGIANFNNSDNAQYISIRYLINFNSSISLIGGEYGVSDTAKNNINVDTMVSTYINFKSGVYTFDEFMNKTTQYGPLSTDSTTILDTSYLGVFNENFEFRKAVEGKIEATETTDKFINDYFQFVAFTKVNDYLIEKIGWKEIAYYNAALDFANDIDAVVKMLDLYKTNNPSDYSNLVTSALDTDSWISNCNNETIIRIIEELLKDKDYSSLQSLLDYLLFSSSNTNAITTSIKTNVIKILTDYINNINDLDIKEYLNSILFSDSSTYSSVLTCVFSSSLSDNVAVQNKLIEYFNKLSLDDLKTIAFTYINFLKNSDSIVTNYLDQSSLVNFKRQVIKVWLTNVNMDICLDIYKNLNISSSEESKVLKMIISLENMTDDEKKEIYNKVITSNTNTTDFSEIIDALNSEIKYYENVSNELGFTYSQDSDLALKSNYITLWNKIRTNSEFQTYLEGLLESVNDVEGNSHNGIYALATEARNTFRSDTVPAPNGRDAETINEDKKESLIFDYSLEVTPDTYFYGPFTNQSGEKYSGTINSKTYSTPSGFSDITNQSGGNRYVNIFLTTDVETAQEVIGDNYTNYIFFWDQNRQFVSRSYFDGFSSATSSNTYVNDYSGGIIDGDSTISRFTLTSGTGSTSSPLRGTYSITTATGVKTDYTNELATDYANILLSRGTKYYLYAGNYTGIYMYYNPYSTFNASYFTAKKGDSVKWYTTQYIDYSVTDLCNLDGILTTYSAKVNSQIASQDEIDIINNICNNYLFTSTNKDNSIKLIKKILLTLLEDNSDFINTFFNSIINNNNTNIISSSTSSTIKDYLQIDSLSFSDYFINNYNGDTSDDISIYASIDLDNFKILVDYLFNETDSYYAYLYNSLDLSGLNDTQIKYLLDFCLLLKEEDSSLTSDEIINIVSNINISDLTSGLLSTFDPVSGAINSLSDFTTSNFESVVDIVDYNSNTYFFGLKSTSSDSTISFTSNKNGQITIIAKGSGSVTLSNGTSSVSQTLSTINEYVFDLDVTSSDAITLTCPSGITIYEIKIKEKYSVTKYNWQIEELTNFPSITPGITELSPTKKLKTNKEDQTFTLTMPSYTSSNRTYYLCIYIKGIGSTSGTVTIKNGNTSINMSTSTYSNSEYTTIKNSGNLSSSTTYTITFSQPVEIYGIELYYSSRNRTVTTLTFNDWSDVTSNSNSNFTFPTTTYTEDDYKESTSFNNLDRLINDYAGVQLDTITSKTYSTTSTELNYLYSYLYKQIAYKSLDLTSLSVSSITNGTVHNDFTFNIGSNNMTITDGINKTINSNTFTKELHLIDSSNSISFNISKSSYIFAYTNGSSNLDLSNGAILYSKVIDDGCFVYSVDTTNETTLTLKSNNGDDVIYDIVIVNKNIDYNSSLEELYPGITTLSSSDIITKLNSVKKCIDDSSMLSRYTTFISSTKRAEGTELDNLYKNDFTYLITLFSGAKFNYSDSNTLWDNITVEDAKELAILLGVANNTVLKSYITKVEDDSTLKEAIKELVNGENKFITSIIDNLGSSNLTDTQKELIVAAYLSTDYNNVYTNAKTNSTITISNSKMKEVVDKLDSSYQYFNGSTIKSTEFEALMSKVEFNLATQGYGIYALASSYGILNGAFIPDNINLQSDEINAYYELDGTYYVMSSTPKADWRSKKNNDDESTADETSINNAIKVKMKQLKLSIATTIFDLVLENDNGVELTTSSDYIILDISDTEGKITYFIPQNLGDDIVNANYKIKSYDISDKATLETGYESKTFNVTNTNTLRVYAEDTTVYKDYTIEIVKTGDLTMEFTSYSVDDGTITNITSQENISISNISYNNGKLLLNANINNIPNSINISKNIFIDNVNSSTSDNPLFIFNTDPIVSATSTDNINYTGTVTIDITFTSSLSGGTHTLDFIFSDNVKYSIEIIMNKSNEASLISLTFDGEIVEYNNETSKTSPILYGRYFSSNDFAIENGKANYLDNLVVSPHATVTSSATMSLDNVTTSIDDNGNTVYTGGFISYVVTYIVTSEDGTNTNTYTHTLIEQDPFSEAKNNDEFITGSSYNKNKYVSIYKNGTIVDVTPDTNGVINTSFARGSNPKYRITYNLDGFFKPSNTEYYNLISVKETYDKTKYTNQDTKVISSTIKNKGYIISFYDESEIDDYKFSLLYESTTSPISWDDINYRRVYESPNIIISKTESIDDYLKNITFLSEAVKQGTLATVISTEVIDLTKYNDLSSNGSSDFVITSSYGITYKTDTALNAKDYYIVGTVSNTNLEEYAPIFKTEEHATIYRYVTINDTRYLVASFFDENGNALSTFANESLTKFYKQGENNTLGDELQVTNGSVTYNDVTYTINPYLGQTSTQNRDLYMNFFDVDASEDGTLNYVDYIIYAEAYDANDSITKEYYKLYHISIVDLTNTIYFSFTIQDNTNSEYYKNNYVYVQFICYEVDESNKTYELLKDNDGNYIVDAVIGAYAYYNETTGVYELKDSSFQALPYGMYYISLDLVDGHTCTFVIEEKKINASGNTSSDLYSYLPPTSLLSQRISLTIIINESDNSNDPWGVQISTVTNTECTNSHKTTN